MPQPQGDARPSWSWRRWFWTVYLLLLGASHIAQTIQQPRRPKPGQYALTLAAVGGEDERRRPVQLAYTDTHPEGDSLIPVVVLLHGSPASSSFMMPLHRALAERKTMRVITPDMPGFGRSTREIPDYSIEAHARYLIQMLDSLDVSEAHIIAYSMSGGTALDAAAIQPDRFASITMLSAIGVQELELTGDYYLNHAVHGLQLAGLWLMENAVPHFGWMNDALLGVPYARNFFDTDQRPLRGILADYDGPMQIVHGREDFLVRYEVALEHRRLVPQARLHTFDNGGHELVLSNADSVAALIDQFVERVEHGEALIRVDADPERTEMASRTFDPSDIPPATGFNLVVLFVLVVAASFVSEDLACIGAGLMVARGTLTFTTGLSAAFTGIVIGDVLLYAAGRIFGRRALRWPPLKWVLSEDRVERGAAWFRSKGSSVIIASRFLPGTRLPTYVAAGTLKAPFWHFLFYFVVASLLWTPVLVGLSAVIGNQFLQFYRFFEAIAPWVVLFLIITIFSLIHIGLPLLSHRGRRLLRSRWMRLSRWEFWPPFVFYVPIVLYVAGLAVRYRSLTLFTAANPCMPEGGFVGESKSDILQQLDRAGAPIARFVLIEPQIDPLDSVHSFLRDQNLSYPIVLKPDVGERGRGVTVVRSDAEVNAYFDHLVDIPSRYPIIAQEYVPGHEFGVFYIRYPTTKKGSIFSITDKRMLHVEGDGKRTFEDLILDDDRANCMAPRHFDAHADHLLHIPAQGEDIALVEVGTHCRGALFLDGTHLASEPLVRALDQISHQMEGFFFGRFDVRVAHTEDLRRGQDFKILELNGVTSEATHIYDPDNSLLSAYRKLFEQWRLAFEIGNENKQRGAAVTSARDLARLTIKHRFS